MLAKELIELCQGQLLRTRLGVDWPCCWCADVRSTVDCIGLRLAICGGALFLSQLLAKSLADRGLASLTLVRWSIIAVHSHQTIEIHVTCAATHLRLLRVILCGGGQIVSWTTREVGSLSLIYFSLRFTGRALPCQRVSRV